MFSSLWTSKKVANGKSKPDKSCKYVEILSLNMLSNTFLNMVSPHQMR